MTLPLVPADHRMDRRDKHREITAGEWHHLAALTA